MLADAKKRFEGIIAARQQEGFLEVYQNLLAHERRLAAAKGEEHAVPLDFPIQWGVGYPHPFMVSNERKTLLAFTVPETLRSRSSVDAGSEGEGTIRGERLAVVSFELCRWASLGGPNDEVHDGHPLSGKGLDSHTAQLVVNSRKLAELEGINSVHTQYHPNQWSDVNHYIFWFHDSTFECLASGFSVERFEGSRPDLLKIVCERLLT